MALARPQPPTNAHAGRSDQFRARVVGRTAVWGFVLVGGGGFLFGAYRRDPLIMAAMPAAVTVLVLGMSFAAAKRAATLDFWTALASSRGLIYLGSTQLLPFTPLLSAGDQRWCEHWMRGKLRLDPPVEGGAGQLVYQELDQQREGGGELPSWTRERHRATICVMDLEPSMAVFKGIFLRPRRGVFDQLSPDWMHGSATREVSLESAGFDKRYELRVASDQSPLLLRRLFSPSVVDWLAGHPLSPGFELRAGTLVVFVGEALEDAGDFDYLLEAATHVRDRVVAEVGEAVARPVAPSAVIHSPSRFATAGAGE